MTRTPEISHRTVYGARRRIGALARWVCPPLILACALGACMALERVEKRDGMDVRVTTYKLLGLLTLGESEEPVPTPGQKELDALREPLRWANWVGLVAGLAGLGLALAVRAPAIQGIAGTVAVIGGSTWAATFCLLWALALPWWALSLGVAGMAVGLIYVGRRWSLPALCKRIMEGAK